MSLDELYIQDDDELSANLYGETDEDNEDWVRESILDVAYYIRSHKFNNYDRRFMNESNKILNLFESFPKALKALHWEVNKYCVKGFLKCLKYIGKKIKESDLQRRQDTKNIMNENKWRFPENFNAINVADVECERLLQADYKNPVPFQSPLERFDWTITASYYMCWFTMQVS
ncbi:uncharacterized protein LOC142317549 [Lycorma delicatula]|uniref:uncharacterized protein LOC142317549 n=1 Tax=Lycorma delicatula TaxID=130591 RepID=UPI003F5197ED